MSKQVRALEDRLGVRLLQRTTRSVSLTPEGQGLYQRLLEVLGAAREAEEEVTQLHAEPRGRIRVGVPMDFGRAHLATPLAEFAARHPALELEVEFSDRFVDVVEERFDVVVRIGELADSSLVARRLAPCRRMLCASPDYLEASSALQTPRDLRRHARIAYSYESERSLRFRGERGDERVTVPIRHRTNNGHMVLALLREGLGIALIPTFLVAEDLREGRLTALFRDRLAADTSIHAIYPDRRLLSNKVRQLVDFLADHCGAAATPYWDEGLGFGGD